MASRPDLGSGPDVRHYVLVAGNPAGARALIEVRLGVQTEAVPTGDGERWRIEFTAPQNVDLDFLRPDVLPPKAGDASD